MCLYTCDSVGRLINQYIEAGGEILQMSEGVLGHGDLLLYDTKGKLKTIVIHEVYLNPWSSAHTVRKYNRCPKKYKDLIERMADSV